MRFFLKFVSQIVRCSTMHSVIKSYSGNPMQYIYVVSKCFCTAFSQDSLCRLRNDLYCVGWGVKLYSLTHCHLVLLS